MITHNSQQEVKIHMLQFQMQHLKKQQELQAKRVQLDMWTYTGEEIEMAKFDDDANIPSDQKRSVLVTNQLQIVRMTQQIKFIKTTIM